MPLRKKFAAEAIGTFCLVFSGTGAIIANDVSGGSISHVGVALTFGLVVMAMIYTVGDVSGAHLNPAVTFGFYAARRLEKALLIPYITAQCVGAISASAILRLLYPTASTLGVTLPHGSWVQSFGLEFVLTAMLMLVILSVSTGAKEKGAAAGLVIGAVIALEALFAGPICGASMNPARSLGPALISLHLTSLWIYLTAPVLGAMVGVIACRCTREAGCCSRAPLPPLGA